MDKGSRFGKTVTGDPSFLDRAFLLSAILGTAAGYSAFYLFHVVLSAKLFKSAFSAPANKIGENKTSLMRDFQFFLLFCIWYLLSITWAENKLYAIQYCAYVILASLTVHYTVRVCRTRRRIDAALKIVFVVTSIEIAFSVLEGMGVLRLPFSPFSQYASYFGRQADDLTRFSVRAYIYISESPTGFFYNPNNLAAFIALMLPFFALHRKWLVRITGVGAILYVVYMCGARAALIACGLELFICTFVWGGFSGRIGAMASALAAVLLGAGVLDTLRGSANLRATEFAGIGDTVSEFFDNLLGDQAVQGGSADARAILIRNGLHALHNTNGLGVGAGGSKTVQESFFLSSEITAMHNFWIELLVEGGIVFAVIFAAWYTYFLLRLLRVGKFSSDEAFKYYGKSLFTGFLGFVLGGIGPSTVIYMLPMWMMVGVGLALIGLEHLRREHEQIGQPLDSDESGEPKSANALRRSYR